jgi:hypothetical protein
MGINLDEVTSISRDVASQLDQRLKVVSVSTTEGGGDRVEVLVTVAGCHQEPCLHLLNVSRVGTEALEEQIRATLQRSLKAHPVA